MSNPSLPANRGGPVSVTLQPGISTQVLQPDDGRCDLFMQNTGANPALFAFGGDAGTSFGTTLNPPTANIRNWIHWTGHIGCPRQYLSMYSVLGTTIELSVTTLGDAIV